MDLRERASKRQRFMEGVIRFRLPLIVFLAIAWWFGAASWRDTVSTVLSQAERDAIILANLIAGNLGKSIDWARFLGAVALLFLVRGRLHTWKASALSLAFVASTIAICWLLDGSGPVLPAVLSVVLVILVTLFFFARSVWMVGALPASICLYALASWIPGVVGIRGMGWQILVALLAADLFLCLGLIRNAIKSGKPEAGAVVQAAMALLPSVIGTAGLFMAIDVTCQAIGIATFQGKGLDSSGLVYIGYIVISLAVAPSLFSLSPLARTKVKKQRIT